MEHILGELIDNIKEKLSSDEYKGLMDMLMLSKNTKTTKYKLKIFTVRPIINVSDFSEPVDLHYETSVDMHIETRSLTEEEYTSIQYDLSETGYHLLSFNKSSVDMNELDVYYSRYVVNIEKSEN